jgi:ATP-dependent Clp protease ATP-binding subunit ClpB
VLSKTQLRNCLPVQGASGDVHISQETSRLLNRADKLSQDRKDAYLSTELVLLAMLDSNSPVAKLAHRSWRH